MAIVIERAKMAFTRAAIISGLTAGAVFLALEMILIPLFTEDNAWFPIRMIASLIIGKDVLMSALLYGITTPGVPVIYSLGVLTIALILHFTLAIAFSLVISALCRGRSMGAALGIGAACGLVVYLINFYGFTTLFPWFEMGRNLVSIIAHLAFGVVAAFTFVKIYFSASHPIKASGQIA